MSDIIIKDVGVNQFIERQAAFYCVQSVHFVDGHSLHRSPSHTIEQNLYFMLSFSPSLQVPLRRSSSSFTYMYVLKMASKLKSAK